MNLNENYKVINESVNKLENGTVLIALKNYKKYLIVDGELKDEFDGKVEGDYKVCELNHTNANLLRKYFEFTKPHRVLGKVRSFGLGDRLGIATTGHAKLFQKYDANPVFAQQSIRELNLTSRTFYDVLDSATFAVYETHFTKEWGADADHLKHIEDIEYAFEVGYTMLTLDCSEHIKDGIKELDKEEAISRANVSEEIKSLYLGKKFNLEGNEIEFDLETLSKCALIYDEAIEFASMVYFKYITTHDIDFELSIDETSTPTTPFEHFYTSNELYRRGVKLETVAPRFCGEFQKGIDYIGDIVEFEKEMKIHASIARHFGYKLSIHSGSDKFKTFEIIGKYTSGNFHVKTAGTNWLEAMKVVAKVDPLLYREVHKYALSKFDEATKYYHVTTNLNNIPSIDTLKDNELVDLFNNNDNRQLIHITYGFILTDKDENGNYIFKDRLYNLWAKYSKEYEDGLAHHIGKHLDLLYKGFRR